ncbi:SDR family oxidoreductase [Kitasatospora sp. NPDC101235]|uniref:SDR family oxidoreductase n=1 Tax=Kitasatospora sp. NPDC101235 TaxID=3364101 RepID=UPI0038180319
MQSESSAGRLHGRVALVTGATRGLGLAVARRLAAAGATVHLNYAHSEQDAVAAEAELAGLAGRVTAARADVTDPAELAVLLKRIGEQDGRLDILVHNVSSLHPMTPGEPDPAGVHADLATALDPLLHTAGTLAGLMPAGGRIIAVSSIGARAVVPRYLAAGVAKAALESLVRYLAVGFAARDVAVNAVSTAKLAKGGEPTPQEQQMAQRSPSGRLTVPDDVAGVVELLCSPEAGWIRGQTITVDGGQGLLAP